MISQKLILYLRMIRFSHSVFALPFAMTAALLAAGGIPAGAKILWITVAMVAARSGAMGMNRLIDMKIDARNPRTKDRELPAGRLKAAEAFVFSAVSFAVLIFAAYKLNPLCLKLSPIAIAVTVFYSYTKRFTWVAHLVLGLALSGAPLGAWMAVRGTFDTEVLPLAFAVLLWLPGFDMIYALQDADFDKKHGLFSFPARFGTGKTLVVSRLLHFASWGLLASTGIMFELGYLYWAGMAVTAGFFIYEHRLLAGAGIEKNVMVFFNMNGYVSATVFLFTLSDYLILGKGA